MAPLLIPVVRRPSQDGATPTLMAAEKNSSAALELLLAASADANEAIQNGATPAISAAEKNNSAALESWHGAPTREWKELLKSAIDLD